METKCFFVMLLGKSSTKTGKRSGSRTRFRLPISFTLPGDRFRFRQVGNRVLKTLQNAMEMKCVLSRCRESVPQTLGDVKVPECVSTFNPLYFPRRPTPFLASREPRSENVAKHNGNEVLFSCCRKGIPQILETLWFQNAFPTFHYLHFSKDTNSVSGKSETAF